MPYWNEKFEGMSEQQQWECRLFGDYAEKLLLNKYPEMKQDGKTPKQIDTKISITSICGDKRRKNTVRRVLEEVTNGPLYGDYLIVDHDKFLEKAPQYASRPEFDLSGSKKEGYKELKPLNDPTQAYRHIKDLTSRENIYVYLHQNKYIFKLITRKISRTHRRFGYGISIYHEMKIFPKVHLDDIEKAIFRSRVEDIARRHAQLVMRAVYNVEPKYLHGKDDDYDLSPTTFLRVEGYDGYTEESLTKRIVSLAKVVRIYRKALQETLEFGRAVRAAGGFKVDEVVDKLTEHLMLEAPLYINDEKHDDLQAFAKDILKYGCAVPEKIQIKEYQT